MTKKETSDKVLPTRKAAPKSSKTYSAARDDIVELLQVARQTAARTVNAIITATYWEIGRRIVEFEQAGAVRAGYGDQLIERLADDLTEQFGRGFGVRNLAQMRAFYRAWPIENILQTLSAKSGSEITVQQMASRFPLPWSAYTRLLSVADINAREFYETEALRGGWSVRQLDRQINSQFYERTANSRNKAAMLRKGAIALPEDAVSPEAAIKDPFVLEFLDLKDEYSESDLEGALIHRLEDFLLELGDDFAFVGRQRRLRVGDEWYRIDLLFFHRRLKALVVIDLKIGKFTHADAGQMHLYLNYAREHWMHDGENPPVGLILCAQKDAAVARYALDGLPNKIMAAEYKTLLPDTKLLAEELSQARRALDAKRLGKP